MALVNGKQPFGAPPARGPRMTDCERALCCMAIDANACARVLIAAFLLATCGVCLAQTRLQCAQMLDQVPPAVAPAARHPMVNAQSNCHRAARDVCQGRAQSLPAAAACAGRVRPQPRRLRDAPSPRRQVLRLPDNASIPATVDWRPLASAAGAQGGDNVFAIPNDEGAEFFLGAQTAGNASVAVSAPPPSGTTLDCIALFGGHTQCAAWDQPTHAVNYCFDIDVMVQARSASSHARARAPRRR
jgi:hypothetical protein